MRNMFKNVHSKRFLLTYLGLVAILLLFYLSMNQQQDALQPESESYSMLTVLQPAVKIPQLLAHTTDNKVFTNATLTGKWTFVFMPAADCSDCEAIIRVLSNLKAGLANRSIQVALIDTSGDNAAWLSELNRTYHLQAQVMTLSGDHSERQSWRAFFHGFSVRSPQALNETVFLINPKGLLMARYQAPFTSVLMRQGFIQLRKDYATNS